MKGAILLAALVLRLALPAAAYVVAGDPAVFITPDTFTYLGPAQSLQTRGAFATGDTPEIFRTPGYPLLLAVGAAAGHPVVMTLLLQAIIGTFAVWCVMRTASLLHRDLDRDSDRDDDGDGDRDDDGGRDGGGANTIARRCGWLMACEPLTLLVGARLLADSLLASLVTLLVLLIVMWLRRPTTRVAMAVAVTLATAAYVKPIAYYLAIPLLAWLWIEGRRRRRRGRRRDRDGAVGRQLVAAGLTLVVLLGAWHVRNGVRTGFWGFSTLTARAVFVGVGGSVSAARDGRAFGEIRRERLQSAGAGTDAEAFHIHEMYARGLRDLLDAPDEAIRVYLKGLLLTLFDPGSLEYLRLFDRYPAESPVTRYTNQGLHATIVIIAQRYPAVLWWSLVMELVLLTYFVLAVRGLWRMRPLGTPALRLLILIGLYFLLLAGGIFGTARFRAPVMPMIVLIAGYGWWPRRAMSSYTDAT